MMYSEHIEKQQINRREKELQKTLDKLEALLFKRKEISDSDKGKIVSHIQHMNVEILSYSDPDIIYRLMYDLSYIDVIHGNATVVYKGTRDFDVDGICVFTGFINRKLEINGNRLLDEGNKLVVYIPRAMGGV